MEKSSALKKILFAGGVAGLAALGAKDDSKIKPFPKEDDRVTHELSAHDTLGSYIATLDEMDPLLVINRDLAPTNLHKPIGDVTNADTKLCILQNAYHEGRGEVAVNGDLAIGAVTLGRALDPKKRFQDKREDGLPKIFGDVCGAVTQKNAFSWTVPGVGVLKNSIKPSAVREYATVRSRMLAVVGDSLPDEALGHLLRKSGFDFIPLYYHATYMWGDYIGDDGKQHTYGQRPTRRAGESAKDFRVRAYKRSKMSPPTAKMFAGLRQKALESGQLKEIGNHIFYGDGSFTITDIKEKKSKALLAQN